MRAVSNNYRKMMIWGPLLIALLTGEAAASLSIVIVSSMAQLKSQGPLLRNWLTRRKHGNKIHDILGETINQ